MNLDAFSISALADEFRMEIMGGRVQKVVQLTPLSFGIEIYSQSQRRYLTLSAEPSAPRVFLRPEKHRRGDSTPIRSFSFCGNSCGAVW